MASFSVRPMLTWCQMAVVLRAPQNCLQRWHWFRVHWMSKRCDVPWELKMQYTRHEQFRQERQTVDGTMWLLVVPSDRQWLALRCQEIRALMPYTNTVQWFLVIQQLSGWVMCWQPVDKWNGKQTLISLIKCVIQPPPCATKHKVNKLKKNKNWSEPDFLPDLRHRKSKQFPAQDFHRLRT